jgi:hypothetical protein
MSARTLVALVLAAAALAGCSSSGRSPANSDASVTPHDAGPPESAAPGCFTTPKTYLEIINACTDAQAVDKTDDLSPMNLPDGGLQPLP